MIRKPVWTFGFFLVVALAATAVLRTGSLSALAASPSRAEAERIFAFDRAHPQRLPAHLVRSLSLAIAFRDDDGAQKLVQILGRTAQTASTL